MNAYIRKNSKEIACIFGMTAAIFAGMIQEAGQTVQHLEDDVLRLHILANSDSAADQLLKYEVRDAVLKEGQVYFQGMDAMGQAEAMAHIQGCLPQIEEIARKTVAAEGYDYTVTAELTEMAFDDRVYESVTMPAGVYDAVRIRIGEAAGQNWWCVMYPPLCVPAAVAEDAPDEREQLTDEEMLKKCFTEKESDLLQKPQKYRVRLKCVEWLKKLWAAME